MRVPHRKNGGTPSVTYDGFGRINSKTGVTGTYTYYTGTHRVSNANGKAYSYDANGNVDYAGSATDPISWTTFNQPMALPTTGGTTTFKYGADYERRHERVAPTGGAVTFDRYMLHAGAATFYEEDLLASGLTDQRAYLAGPAGPVGVLEFRLNANGANITTSERYWHRDHLGSTSAISGQNGEEAGRYRFDPWGKPLATPLQGSAVGTGNRGFTGHEHLVGGLIHMNGRIYDPVLGRFLSADIVVQMPHNIQSYNRYSYVLNNPLIATDPSGYFFWFAVAALFVGFGYATGGVQFARQIAGIAAGILLGPAGPYAASMAALFGGGAARAFASAVFAGFASGGLSSGNLQGAFKGAAGAALGFGVGLVVGEAVSFLEGLASPAFTAPTQVTLGLNDAMQQSMGGYRFMNFSDVSTGSQQAQMVERIIITGNQMKEALVGWWTASAASFNTANWSASAAIAGMSALPGGALVTKGPMLIGKAGHAAGSVWSKNPWVRGGLIEDKLFPTRTVSKNYNVIDDFVDGTATSVKSIDLQAKTYQNGGGLSSKVNNYITKLADFEGVNIGGVDTRFGVIQDRVLLLAIPNVPNPAQQIIFNNLATTALAKDVTLILRVVP